MPLEIYVINRLVKGGDVTVPLAMVREDELINISSKEPNMIGTPIIYTKRKIDGGRFVIDFWPKMLDDNNV